MNEHRAKLQEIIERDFSASLLNTTKWMELLEIVPLFAAWSRVKLITSEKPSQWMRGFQVGGPDTYLPRGYVEGWYSPIDVLEIEWLEVELDESAWSREGAVYERTKELAARLDALAVPYTVAQNVLRVVGHIRY